MIGATGQSFEVLDTEGRFIGRVAPEGGGWQARADAWTIVGTYDRPGEAAQALRTRATSRRRQIRGFRPTEGRDG